MTNPERSKQAEEKEIIKVRQGELFSLPSVDLNSLEKDYGDSEVIQSFKLKIEGIGTGRAEVKKDKSTDYRFIPIKTPAGPLKSILGSIYVEVFIDNLPESELGAIQTTLVFRGEPFRGNPAYDEVELKLDGKAELMFYNWTDPKTGEKCEVYFPPDADILKQISFVIERKSTS